MTSKERVLKSIRHEEPDRVPTGEWQFGLELGLPVLGEKCKCWLEGLERAQAYWDGKRDEITEQRKTDLVKLVKHFGWDAVLLHNVIGKNCKIAVPKKYSENKWRYDNGDELIYSAETDRLFICSRGEGTVSTPEKTPEEWSSMPYVEPDDSELELVRHVVKELGSSHFLFSLPLQGHPQLGFSDTTHNELDVWMELYENRELFKDKLMAQIESKWMRKAIEKVAEEGLDGVAGSWDFGMTSGPFMSPEIFEEAIFPYIKAYADIAHDCGLVLLWHSCGNNQDLMPMMVEAGVDVYQSIQPEMDIIKMKELWGDKITLWGGINADLLINGSADEVFKHSTDIINKCKTGGAYIFGTSHSVMPGSKLENYKTMLRSLQSNGFY